MSPEEQLQQAADSLDSADTLEEIDQLLADLEFVYEALQPQQQVMADGLKGRLRHKRKALE